MTDFELLIILFADELACADKASCEAACGRPNGCADIAYAKLVLTLMPAAARGLMLAVMLSALISSLTSIFSSASTIFTIDVWQRWRTQASEIEQMIVGRLFVLVLIAISIAWIPVVRSGSTLFQYIQVLLRSTYFNFTLSSTCTFFAAFLTFRLTLSLYAIYSYMQSRRIVGLAAFFLQKTPVESANLQSRPRFCFRPNGISKVAVSDFLHLLIT